MRLLLFVSGRARECHSVHFFPSYIQGSAEVRGRRGSSRGKRSEDIEEAFAERTFYSRWRSDGSDVRAARERERVRAL
jgi:hypothetical protein